MTTPDDTYFDNAEMLSEWAKLSAEIGSKTLSVLYGDEPVASMQEVRYVLVTRVPDDHGAEFTFDAMEGFPKDALQPVPSGWRGRLVRWLSR